MNCCSHTRREALNNRPRGAFGESARVELVGEGISAAGGALSLASATKRSVTTADSTTRCLDVDEPGGYVAKASPWKPRDDAKTSSDRSGLQASFQVRACLRQSSTATLARCRTGAAWRPAGC